MNCWFCQGDMFWQGDFNFEDYCIEDEEGDGVIALLLCSKCNATAEFYSKWADEDAKEENDS